MSTHIGDACRAAGLLPIAMAVKCTKLDRFGRARIVDFCHRLLTAAALRLVIFENGDPEETKLHPMLTGETSTTVH